MAESEECYQNPDILGKYHHLPDYILEANTPYDEFSPNKKSKSNFINRENVADSKLCSPNIKNGGNRKALF